MKTFIISVFMLFFVSVLSTASAVPKGEEIKYTKSPMGEVTFSGTLHEKQKLKCDSCHPEVFEEKKGAAQMKLPDHMEGKKFCFSCHNGTKSFASKDNCNKCHKPPAK